jgi:MFS family permease
MSKTFNACGKFLPFFMWFIPLMFFAHQFILRLWPGLMMPQIMNQFSIDATSFGALASSYYYGYAGMQIPVAILLDRYGARIIVCVFAIISGVASIIFTYTDVFYIALVSRFLIGVGSSAAFLGVSKVLSEWFDQKLYTRMVGFSFTFGLMGAVYGGRPVGLLVERFSSESVAFAIGLVSIAIGCLAYLFLRSSKNSNHKQESLNLSGLKSILSSKLIWTIAISNLLLVGFLEGFADVWGVQYIMASYNISKSSAAGFTSCIFLGMLVGGPILAWAGEKVGESLVIAIAGSLMATVFITMLCNLIALPLLPYCFFFVGIMCCYQVLVFALGSNLVGHKNMGICIAFLNSVNMLGGCFYHTVIGIAMDTFWGGQINTEGLREYATESYQYALSIIPICAIFGSLIFMLIYTWKTQRAATSV